jgi:phosphoglycolate phosphatase-like HAD superfamily hydrolase
MIGDRESDLMAGTNAGCKTALVRTGYGHETSATIDLKTVNGIGVFDSVEEAVREWMKAL